MLIINPEVRIPYREFEFSFVRSSGPGGQNVNKVNSKAVLRWNPYLSHSLPHAVLNRFIMKYSNRLTTENEIIITCDETRDQKRNQERCVEKLKEMILLVLYPPKLRKKTKPTKSAQRKRVDSKKAHSFKKIIRRKTRIDDY